MCRKCVGKGTNDKRGSTLDSREACETLTGRETVRGTGVDVEAFDGAFGLGRLALAFAHDLTVAQLVRPRDRRREGALVVDSSEH